MEDLRRVLDSQSKRRMNETTTDFEMLRELIMAMLAERKEVIGIPYMKDLTDEVDGAVEIARDAAHHFCTREFRLFLASRNIQELRLDYCIELFDWARGSQRSLADLR